MNKLILSLLLVTIICSSTATWAQKVGDTVYYNDAEAKVIGVTAGKLFPGEKEHLTYKLKLKDGTEVLANESDLLEIVPKRRKPIEKEELNLPRIGDTVHEDKLRTGKVTKVTKDYVAIEVQIPMSEIKPFVGVVGRFPVEALPPQARPDRGRFSGRPRPIVTQLKEKIQETTISRQQLIDKLLKENAELKAELKKHLRLDSSTDISLEAKQ